MIIKILIINIFLFKLNSPLIFPKNIIQII